MLEFPHAPLYLVYMQCWGSNPRRHSFSMSTLPIELHPQPSLLTSTLQTGQHNGHAHSKWLGKKKPQLPGSKQALGKWYLSAFKQYTCLS